VTPNLAQLFWHRFYFSRFLPAPDEARHPRDSGDFSGDARYQSCTWPALKQSLLQCTNWRPRVTACRTDARSEVDRLLLIVRGQPYYEGVARPTTRVPDSDSRSPRRSLQCSCSRIVTQSTLAFLNANLIPPASSRLNAPSPTSFMLTTPNSFLRTCLTW